MKTEALTASVPQQTTQDTDRLRSIAQEFESLFSSMMIKAMRKTIGEGSFMPASMGEKIYTGMLDDEYAKMISSGSGLGLAKLIENELRRLDNPGAVKIPSAPPSWLFDNKLLGNTNSLNVQSSGSLDRLTVKIEQWDKEITHASKKYGVDSSLVAAVIAQESGGNRHAISRAGAKGLMQLMDGTAKDMGVTLPFEPSQNIEGGVKYLKKLLDKYGGNEELALASYNAGPGAVDKYKGIPPYKETQQYVRSVSALKKHMAQQSKPEVNEE